MKKEGDADWLGRERERVARGSILGQGLAS